MEYLALPFPITNFAEVQQWLYATAQDLKYLQSYMGTSRFRSGP